MAPLYRSLMILALLFISCSGDKAPPNFSRIDSLIAGGNPGLARGEIERALKEVADSTDIKKLRHRLRLVDIREFYDPVYKALTNGDTSGIRARVLSKTTAAIKTDSIAARWYLFDANIVGARLDSMRGDWKGWAESLNKALDYPTPSVYQKTDICFLLARHAMERKAYDEGRAFLDRALRGFPKKDFSGELTDIYLLYMNGEFTAAFDGLKGLDEKELPGRWKKVRTFLAKYKDRLTLKDRFKLW